MFSISVLNAIGSDQSRYCPIWPGSLCMQPNFVWSARICWINNKVCRWRSGWGYWIHCQTKGHNNAEKQSTGKGIFFKLKPSQSTFLVEQTYFFCRGKNISRELCMKLSLMAKSINQVNERLSEWTQNNYKQQRVNKCIRKFQTSENYVNHD